jgi:membrane-bound lytic murein transglycosylase D
MVRSPSLLIALAACSVAALTGALVGARPAASPTEAPEDVRLELAALSGDVDAREVENVAASADLADELLATPMLSHPDFLAEVGRWVRFWETAPTEWFPEYLARMSWFEGMVDSTLAAHGLPWSLRYLPVIESGYSPSAVSSASAVGLWQFMPHTAKDFDIEVSGLVDDRRDPFVATNAAADFLVELRERFGSWFLALAAYNAGPERIEVILERYAPDAERTDALYWAIRKLLPRETADFVPNLFGAIIVASDPEAHGYDLPEPRSFDFEEVPVLGRVSFDTVARATGTSPGEIARLNPEYVRGVTPPGKVVRVRVPVGSAASFRAYFEERGRGVGPGR